MGAFSLRAILGLSVAAAVAVALAVGVARIGWEGSYREVGIALNLGDLYRLAGEGPHPPPEALLQGFLGQGLAALTVSPRDVRELRAAFTALRPEGAPLTLAEVRRRREQGFVLYWRLDTWVSPARFAGYLDVLLSLKPRGLLLAHPLALPPSGVEALFTRLKGSSVLVGRVEFVDPPGLDGLYDAGFRGFVRAHLLKPEERRAMGPEETRDRYLQAARERNVRLLELRALRADQAFRDLGSLTAALEGAGFSLGLPAAPPPFRVSPWASFLVWLGAMALLGWAVARTFGWAPPALAPLVALGAASGALGWALMGEAAWSLAAWVVAVGAPVAGFALLLQRPSWPAGVRGGVATLFACSAVSVLGGLWTAALLSSEAYFTGVAAFRGVKLALALPLFGVALLGFRRAAKGTLRARDLFVWVGVGLLLAYVLIRSGNFAFGLVPGFEGELRAWLEAHLGVRPRFKEFLVGHPLLLLWGTLGPLRQRPWALGLLCVGFLGQVSIVNTFAHLHTPLPVALARTAHGLWLGAALGGLLWAFLERLRLWTGQ